MGLLKRIEEREKNREEGASIETDIDRIHSLVGKYGSMALKDIAVALKLNTERVEELAKILDKYRMAELYYPPVGSAVLRKSGSGAKGGKPKKSKNINLVIFGSVLLIIMIAAIALMKIYGVI